jgi:hypothetical protein
MEEITITWSQKSPLKEDKIGPVYGVVREEGEGGRTCGGRKS